MLDEGVHASVSEIGHAENISKSYASRILRLAFVGAGDRAVYPGSPNGSRADVEKAGASAAGVLGRAAQLPLYVNQRGIGGLLREWGPGWAGS